MNPKKVSRSPIKCSAAELVASRFRQIHLDFHTSELIPDVGGKFDADVFGDTLADARVNWVTLFAKCHHGMSFYPTKVGCMHPSLKIDLLGEQIEACRKRGIVTPAYISVRCDEYNARTHRDQVVQMKDGKLWKWGDALQPGWMQNCLNNDDYVEQLGEQAREVLKWYDVEGIFFDMCYTAEPGCYCPRCYDAMKKRVLDFTSDEDHRRFEYQITREYTKKLTKICKDVRKNATTFFNSRVHPGVAAELDVLTHLEIEALATGGWGYAYFPIHARYARVHPRPVQGMTARFHKSWADFGGVKTPDMMLYEAGSILAAGAVMNVGDQCHPRGILDKGSYEVIGKAFSHVEACEPWCTEVKAASEVAVMMLPANKDSVEQYKRSGGLFNNTDGAGRMLLELKQQFDIVYPETKLSQYKVVILPDYGYMDDKTRKVIAAYLKQGGKLIVSHEHSLENGKLTCPGLPVTYEGAFPSKPCYLKLGKELGAGLPESNFVFYEDAAMVKPAKGAKVFGNLCSSYFNRAFDHFCSHNQTPDDKVTNWPILVMNKQVAYISACVFRAYRDHSYGLYKKIVAKALAELLPAPMVKVKCPSAMEVSVNRQPKEKRLVAHLVNFQPQRRHIQVEWIEELYPVCNIELEVRTGKRPSAVYLAPSKKAIPFQMKGEYCCVTVPQVVAHEMVAFEGV